MSTQDAGCNAYHHIDYKRPMHSTWPRNEMRTSTYIGLRKFRDTGNKFIRPMKNTCRVLQEKEPHFDNKTEYGDKFAEKIPEYALIMNAGKTAFHRKVQGMKDYDAAFKVPPRPMKLESTYHSDYSTKFPQQCDTRTKIYCMPSSVEKAKHIVDAEKPSYSKYADMMATTYLLDYPPHSLDQRKGIGNHDAITFYNWQPNKALKKTSWANRQIPTASKFLPNYGLKTEYQDEYKPENFHKVFDARIKTYAQTLPRGWLIPPTTEYSMYGSGVPIHRYIVANKKKD